MNFLPCACKRKYIGLIQTLSNLYTSISYIRQSPINLLTKVEQLLWNSWFKSSLVHVDQRVNEGFGLTDLFLILRSPALQLLATGIRTGGCSWVSGFEVFFANRTPGCEGVTV